MIVNRRTRKIPRTRVRYGVRGRPRATRGAYWIERERICLVLRNKKECKKLYRLDLGCFRIEAGREVAGVEKPVSGQGARLTVLSFS